jgi:hypothetical protein
MEFRVNLGRHDTKREGVHRTASHCIEIELNILLVRCAFTLQRLRISRVPRCGSRSPVADGGQHALIGGVPELPVRVRTQ